MALSKQMSLADFLHLCKVVRMLYTVEVSRYFFEKNLEEFTGYTQEDLRQLLSKPKNSVNIPVTHEL